MGDANNSGPNNQKTIKIGFSSPNLNDRFQRYIQIVALERARKNNIDFLLADALDNITMQQVQIKSLIKQGINGLIVVPVDTNSMAPVTAWAKEAGIPLVYLNRNPYPNGNMPEGVYYVGANETEIGRLQGEFIGENLKSGNLGILMGPENNESTIARLNGMQQVLSSKYPNIKIIAKDIANWDKNQAYRTVNGWLARYGLDLNAIVAGNDEMALGANQALQEAGRKDVMVVGVDGLPPAREAIENGSLAATVFVDANAQGEAAVDILQELIQGKQPEKQVSLFPLTLITSSNVAEYQSHSPNQTNVPTFLFSSESAQTFAEKCISSVNGVNLDQSDPIIMKYLASNPKTGFLKMKVSTLNGAVPISDALISIFLVDNNIKYLITAEKTDQDGLTGPISLPTPDKSETFTPRARQDFKPYADYSIVIERDGYQKVELQEIPIFDGITSIQRVDMIAEKAAE